MIAQAILESGSGPVWFVFLSTLQPFGIKGSYAVNQL